jgi:protein arginine kinase activator
MTEGKDAMNYCDDCGNNQATVHLTHITGESAVVFHLCEECAKKKGVSISIVTDEPSRDDAGSPAPDCGAEAVCPGCRMPFSEFKSKGRLGCSQCYRTFEKDIDSLLKQVHGALIHRGKVYSIKFPISTEVKDLDRLRGELDDAIKKEEFEIAAALRDAIHSLSGKNALEEQTRDTTR